jgi:hypothetical protein
MSWKSLVSAGLLCVLASPLLAAPTLTVTGGRRTTTTTGANNVRIWNVAVSPDLALDPTGSPLALELGFRATGGNILGISSTQNQTPEVNRVEHTDNPGAVIFGWETLSDTDGDGSVETNGDDEPVGHQVGTGANATQGVSYIGTNIFTTAQKQDLITIRTDTSVTSLAWGGRYNADHSMAAVGAFINGRIAQSTGATTSENYDTFAGSLAANAAGATRFLGDMNGDGSNNFTDLGGFGQALTNAAAYRAANPHLNRFRADVNGDGAINFSDLGGFGQIILGTAPTGAGSALGGSAVPEPAAFVLAGMGVALAATIRRKRG